MPNDSSAVGPTANSENKRIATVTPPSSSPSIPGEDTENERIMLYASGGFSDLGSPNYSFEDGLSGWTLSSFDSSEDTQSLWKISEDIYYDGSKSLALNGTTILSENPVDVSEGQFWKLSIISYTPEDTNLVTNSALIGYTEQGEELSFVLDTYETIDLGSGWKEEIHGVRIQNGAVSLSFEYGAILYTDFSGGIRYQDTSNYHYVDSISLIEDPDQYIAPLVLPPRSQSLAPYDGSFENGIAGWTDITQTYGAEPMWEISSEDARLGDQSILASYAVFSLEEPFEVSAGQEVYFSVWFKRNSSAPWDSVGMDQVALMVDGIDSEGVSRSLDQPVGRTANDWLKISTVVTVPSDVVSLSFSILVATVGKDYSPIAGGFLFIDDVEIYIL